MNLRLLIFFLCAAGLNLSAQRSLQQTPAISGSADTLSPSAFSALKFRMIGPAVNSGRIIDLAVNPKDKSEWYVAAACGGVWKTTNAGVTFTPVFDQHRVWSVGCVALDPSQPATVWIGTGENNNQRSVGYGNGVYRSDDGGKTFTHMGLRKSEHIGMITVDPRNSQVVYVAAYGPLWNEGGERGLYKTTDGGKTWNLIHKVSEHTGCNEVHLDPRNPDIVYAAFHQRRRHEWTYVSGGPESAVFRSIDGGASWKKLGGGLPAGDMGRIALAMAPSNPDIMYAMVEATDNAGLYRSENRGASWNKVNTYATAGNYYQELFVDPKNADRVYIMDTYLKVSHDGGKTIVNAGEKSKHVDNHAIWIDPEDTRHVLAGCDGGLYESWDRCATWDFKQNLPITQFYRVSVDNAKPFYNIYGGTQDNNTLGGPSRTRNASGIVNSDWFVTVGGDGFKSQVDPNDPNIVYSQWQYGGLVRHDRRSGETTDIKPMEAPDEPALRWNWDAPLEISRHNPARLYFAANRIYRTDDRGQSWRLISPDLSRGIDRNKLPVMGKVWSMDAVAKNQSTSIYGNIVSFAESPLDENLLYAGTDDGLVHLTTDGGKTWKKLSGFSGVPEMAYVSCITASRFDANVVFVTFQHHRSGDFKPYVYLSRDKGQTWISIRANLPEEGMVWTLKEDHAERNLLFVGTEFGLWFTIDGGKRWNQLKNGLPPAAIKDIAIQERENDLVLATFGRGFAVLDDYSMLRSLSMENNKKPAHIYPVRDALMFMPSYPLGDDGKANQGENYFTAPNPPIGAVISYHLRDDYKTLKELRKERESARIKAGKPVYYPSVDSIRLEDKEEAPYLVFAIRDDARNLVRLLQAPAKKGSSRIVWNFRMPVVQPVSLTEARNNDDPVGPGTAMVPPGRYTVEMYVVQNGVISKLSDTLGFNCVHLNNATFSATDKAAVFAYARKATEMQRAAMAGWAYFNSMNDRLKHLRKAAHEGLIDLSAVLPAMQQIQLSFNKLETEMMGDASLARREFETLPGIMSRVRKSVYGLYYITGAPTETWKTQYQTASQLLVSWLENLRSSDVALRALEDRLEAGKAPYTPGRFPIWKPE
jgi:photosystem II stability/assembly factor-like uncharacterized protein